MKIQMRIITFIVVNIFFMDVYGQLNKNISVDTELLSYYIESKSKIFNLTYSITNLSNETQYFWFNANKTVDDSDLIKEFFFTKKDGSCFYQIAMESNAIYVHGLFDSFIKKLDNGKSFDLEFISQKKISEREIAEIVTFLDQTIVVVSESEIIKNVREFQSFNPLVFYPKSSLPLFVDSFLKTIRKITKQNH